MTQQNELPTPSESKGNSDWQIPSTHVRWTRGEYLQAKRIQIETGKSLPWLLKTALLNAGIAPPVLDHESRATVRKVIAYAGNNLNQIAKRVNSGIYEGFQSSFEDVAQSLRTLRSFLNLNHGDPRT